ncbi:MAG: LytTR family DNA-binding domain-containing protein [Bacteroidota bacterium]
MKILLVEDETRIAKLLEKMIREIWGNHLSRLHHCHHLGEANNFLSKYTIDLLFLDLNLQGESGFDLLHQYTTQSFHTVIVSAYRDKAIEAFEYGVLDFVPKPFSHERLQKTLDRLVGENSSSYSATKFIPIKKSGRIVLIPIAQITYVQADGHYTSIHLANQSKEICDHSMEKLLVLLPASFIRIHRSYIVHLPNASEIRKSPGSKVELVLNDGTTLPIGRSRLKEVEKQMMLN